MVLATQLTSTSFPKKEQGPGVWLAGEELIKGLLEQGLFGLDAGEQREAGAQLQVIRAT
ncbi:hypothetical protein D3C75_1321020 [compost metagenome]